jgi:hypothetical protein
VKRWSRTTGRIASVTLRQDSSSLTGTSDVYDDADRFRWSFYLEYSVELPRRYFQLLIQSLKRRLLEGLASAVTVGK